MTNSHQILAHVGAGSDHHIRRARSHYRTFREVLRTGRMTIAHAKEEVGCSDPIVRCKRRL